MVVKYLLRGEVIDFLILATTKLCKASRHINLYNRHSKTAVRSRKNQSPALLLQHRAPSGGKINGHTLAAYDVQLARLFLV